MSKNFWVREGTKVYTGADVFKTATFWKVSAFFLGVPLAVAGVLLLHDKLSKKKK